MRRDRKANRIRLDGQKCMDRRRTRGLTREALAVRGLSVSTIRRAEESKHIYLESARVLAEQLGTTLDSLTRDSAPPPLVLTVPPAESVTLAPGAQRGPVGRDAELSLIEQLLGGLRHGGPSLLLLSGQTGVGKTRLLQVELGQRAEALGAPSLYAKGFEHADFPLQLWLDALMPARSWLVGHDPTDARVLDGWLAASGGEGLGQPQSEQLLSFAIVRALVSAASESPIVLVVDDLQWADAASLRVVEQLIAAASREAATGRPLHLLLALGYRSDATDGRVDTLVTGCRREPFCHAREVRDLGMEETAALIEELGISRPTQAMVTVLYDATRGNPLFVKEALGVMRERGLLGDGAGFDPVRSSASDVRFPRTLTAALRERVEALDSDTRDLLIVAACLGQRFELAELSAVAELSEDEVLDHLEVALHRGLLEDRDDRFAFAHPVLWQVCYQLPIAARRRRLHAQIAQRLIALYGDADARAAAIADQLVNGGVITEDAYARITRAAGVAHDRRAFTAASRFYEASLSLGEELGLLDGRELGVRHATTALTYHTWDADLADRHYTRAIELLSAADDPVELAVALTNRIRLGINRGRPLSSVAEDVARLEGTLVAVGDRAHRVRGNALDALASHYWNLQQSDRARELAMEALRLGKRVADPNLCAHVSNSLALSYLQQLQPRAALSRWTRSIAYSKRSGESELTPALALQRIPIAMFHLGELTRAENVAQSAWDLSERSQSDGQASLCLAIRTSIAVARGNLASAEQLFRELSTFLRRYQYAWSDMLALPALAAIRSWSGDRDGARQMLHEVLEPGRILDEPAVLEPFVRLYGALCACHAGETPDVEDLLPLAQPMPPAGFDVRMASVLAARVELAHELERAELAAHAAAPLALAAERGVLLTSGWVFLVPRVRALEAALRGERGEACEHFEAAIVAAERSGAQAELARTCLDYGALLLRQAEGSAAERAVALLQKARTASRELGLEVLDRRASALLG